MKRGAISYKVTLMLLIVVSYFILSGREGGCSKANLDTLKSPVQAICTLVETENGGTVMVDLWLISTLNNQERFITTATNAVIRVPGNNTVPLTMTSPGHYTANSDNDSQLVYEPGGAYLFKFDLEDEGFAGPDYAGEYFSGQINAPTERPATLTATQPNPGPDFNVEISWSPSFPRGIYRVMDSNDNVTDTNWDFDSPNFDGSKWESLLRQAPASHTIQGEAVQSSGDYYVAFGGCAVQGGFQVEMSDKLGVGSGFLACSMIGAELTVP